MRTLHGRLRIDLALVLAAVVAVGLGLGGMIQNASAAPTANVYAVDANTSTAGVQNTRSVNVGAGSFTIEHVIVSVADAWSAEQTNMKFDPAILQFESGPADTNLGSAVLCGGTNGADYVYEGCAKVSGTTTATGVTRSYTFSCKAAGTSALHLQTNGEVGASTGTNFAIAAGVAEPVLQDASVTCAEAQQEPTATHTATKTATATATVTKTATATVSAATKTAQAAASQTAQAGVKTATPTPKATDVPESTATKAPARTNTPVSVVSPAARTPVVTPVGQVGEDTGLPRSGGGTTAETDTLGSLWLILAGIALGALGGSMYLRSRTRA